MYRNKKFIFYDPTNIISDIHFKKEHLTIPITFSNAGYESLVICGRCEISDKDNIRFFETNNTSRNVFYMLHEFNIVFRNFLEEEPEIVMFFQNNVMISMFISLYKLLKPFSRTRWIVFLDFDVDEKNGMRFGVRKLGWIINSIFVNYLTYQSSCHKKILSRYIKKTKILPLQPSYSSRSFVPHKYTDFKRENEILCVCRVVREKGLEILLRSFSIIKDKFQEWNVKVVGPINDPMYYKELLELMNETGIRDRVNFTGKLDDAQLYEEYKKASLFCLPSFSESLGISRFEAAINGIPVVTSDAGCAADMINVGMLVFKKGDIKTLSNMLSDLIENEQLRLAVSEKQLESVKSLEENVLEIIRMIKSSINDNS